MITQPTIPQLLETIRDELGDKVLPQVADAPTKVSIEMMQAVLNQLIERSEHEIAWMTNEIDAIEDAAERLAPTLSQSDALDAAVVDFTSNRAESMQLSVVTADYQRACEVLSCLGEAAYADGSEAAIADVQTLLNARLATENAAVGEFIAVGRD